MNVISIRIYYEDTDFSGIVYHANYLKYFERGRTEGLRKAGHNHSELLESENMVFAVRRMTVDFERPAQIDDVIEVRTEVVLMKGARMNFRQEIWRGDERLVGADIDCVCLSTNGRPRRLPAKVIHNVTNSHHKPSSGHCP